MRLLIRIRLHINVNYHIFAIIEELQSLHYLHKVQQRRLRPQKHVNWNKEKKIINSKWNRLVPKKKTTSRPIFCVLYELVPVAALAALHLILATLVPICGALHLVHSHIPFFRLLFETLRHRFPHFLVDDGEFGPSIVVQQWYHRFRYLTMEN